MRIIARLLILFLCLQTGLVQAAEKPLKVRIAEPYIELRSGPAQTYPIFHVIDRDQWVEVLYRKTDWIKVRSKKGIEGWVHRNEMAQTLVAKGKKLSLRGATFEDYKKRTWELGAMSGDFEGAASLTVFANYYLAPTLSTEFSVTHAIGNFSSNLMANFRVTAHPFPEWRLSPFFALGGGIIDTQPKASLVQTVDRQDPIGHVSLGFNYYVSRRFIFRMEYNNYVVFTSRNDNEEVEEWKAGFAAFF